MIEELKTQFLTIATSHGAAVIEGNYKLSNKLHNELTEIYNKAIKSGFSDLFIKFLSNPNESVRLWAATFSLKSNAKLACETLKLLSKQDSVFSLSASTVLDLWNKGKLELL